MDPIPHFPPDRQDYSPQEATTSTETRPNETPTGRDQKTDIDLYGAPGPKIEFLLTEIQDDAMESGDYNEEKDEQVAIDNDAKAQEEKVRQ